MKYRLYLEPDEDGVFVATCPALPGCISQAYRPHGWREYDSPTCPALPGCISQGQTRAEATENIREAIEGYLISLRKHGDPIPPGIIEEVIEVVSG